MICLFSIDEPELKYEVWYDKKFADGPAPGALVNPNPLYEKIASIKANSLEDVFTQMNTPSFLMKLNKIVRSMSVGDLVKDPDGKFWLCAETGWKGLDPTRQKLIFKTNDPLLDTRVGL